MVGLKKTLNLDTTTKGRKLEFGIGKVEQPAEAKSAQAKLTAQLQDPETILLKAVKKRLQDKSKLSEAKTLIHRIQAANGFPQRRRPSLRDNDLITSMQQVIANDSKTTELKIKGDPRFAHIQRSQLLDFCDGLRTNLHLRTLKINYVELDNEFLSALSAAMETNFTLEHLDLSNNAFTSDALVEFCQAMADNQSLKTVILTGQLSHVLGTTEDDVMQALKQNHFVREFQIDFKNEPAKKQLAKILERNNQTQSNKQIVDTDKKLLDHLKREAVRAEERFEHLENERKIQQITDDHDWEYLYELHELAIKYKHYNVDTADDGKESNSKFSTPLPSLKKTLPKAIAVNYTSDGAFLTEDFISACLVGDDEDRGLTFAFQMQAKLFRRFPVGDKDRRFISEMLADALLAHPHSNKITHINMANCGCGDEWLTRLCERCFADPRLLHRLAALNLETNYLAEKGIMALSKCIASDKTWMYLQSIKLENQRQLISSRAEFALAKAMCINRSVITMSLRVRNLWERDQINNFIVRNVDFLRQARLKHAVKTGTRVERSRNKIEEFFDKIAANDPSITNVSLVGDQLFTALSEEERIKSAKAFAKNTHVKSVKMCHLGLDDKWAVAMATSIEINACIETVNLESNKITSDGIPALVGALGKNKSIVKMTLRHQFRPMDSIAEDKLPGLFRLNETCVKLGLDLRAMLAQSSIEKKLMQNREIARKARMQGIVGKATTAPRLKSVGKMQSWFKQIAVNDSSITEVNLVGDKLFLPMRRNDRLDAARSFATNTHVKSVTMNLLELDDEFTVVLAESIKANCSIEHLILEQNDIRGEGIKAICQALASNASIIELQLRHQKKPMDTAAKETLAGLLGGNETLVKFGVTLRSSRATLDIENILKRNRDLQRKSRVRAKS
jgi:tropomodulin